MLKFWILFLTLYLTENEANNENTTEILQIITENDLEMKNISQTNLTEIYKMPENSSMDQIAIPSNDKTYQVYEDQSDMQEKYYQIMDKISEQTVTKQPEPEVRHVYKTAAFYRKRPSNKQVIMTNYRRPVSNFERKPSTTSASGHNKLSMIPLQKLPYNYDVRPAAKYIRKPINYEPKPAVINYEPKPSVINYEYNNHPAEQNPVVEITKVPNIYELHLQTTSDHQQFMNSNPWLHGLKGFQNSFQAYRQPPSYDFKQKPVYEIPQIQQNNIQLQFNEQSEVFKTEQEHFNKPQAIQEVPPPVLTRPQYDLLPHKQIDILYQEQPQIEQFPIKHNQISSNYLLPQFTQMEIPIMHDISLKPISTPDNEQYQTTQQEYQQQPLQNLQLNYNQQYQQSQDQFQLSKILAQKLQQYEQPTTSIADIISKYQMVRPTMYEHQILYNPTIKQSKTEEGTQFPYHNLQNLQYQQIMPQQQPPKLVVIPSPNMLINHNLQQQRQHPRQQRQQQRLRQQQQQQEELEPVNYQPFESMRIQPTKRQPIIQSIKQQPTMQPIVETAENNRNRRDSSMDYIIYITERFI